MGTWQIEAKKVKKVAVNSKTVTAICLPLKKGYGSKAVQKTWKNYCPLCKRHGTLTFNPKHNETGEWTCSKCDADYCGVSGKDAAVKVRAKLTPATMTSNKKVKVADTETQSKKCNLSKAEAKAKAKSIINTSPSYKGQLEVPANLKITVDDLLSLNFNRFDDKLRFK